VATSGHFSFVGSASPPTDMADGTPALLEPKNVTESCPEPPFILRPFDKLMARDERRVEGDDTGIVTLYFLADGREWTGNGKDQ